MSRYLIVGIEGEDSLKLIDLDAGSVETIAATSVDESIAKVRAAGASVLRGVDVAIAIDDRADAVGRFFFDAGAAR